MSAVEDVPALGYVQEEYFFSGMASSHGQGQTGGTVENAPYASRMIVLRPANPARFNGTVVVEWLNVTLSYEVNGVWVYGWPALVREGFAYVGISAQLVGVCCGPLSLKAWDPVRYAPLVHPGDDYSYDIFSQGIQAVRAPQRNATPLTDPQTIDPMGGLHVERVIGTGASQSASRLTSYINGGFHHDAGVIDGFIISRGGGPYPQLETRDQTPILQFNEESQADNKQPLSKYYRVYEEAGASHVTELWVNYINTQNQAEATAPASSPASGIAPVDTVCSTNRGSVEYSSRLVVHAMNEWLRTGTPPDPYPRLVRDANGILQRDANGLALGGVRHPFIQVPVAHNVGQPSSSNPVTGNPGSCLTIPLIGLVGEYQPWTRDRILAAYPTRDDYVDRVRDWLAVEVANRWILPEEAASAFQAAEQFDPWDGGSCFDTANQSGSASGPLSSQIDATAYDGTLGGGEARLAHQTACAVLAPLGL